VLGSSLSRSISALTHYSHTVKLTDRYHAEIVDPWGPGSCTTGLIRFLAGNFSFIIFKA